jgi:hypothetical protein
VAFDERGPVVMKGLPEPVSLFRAERDLLDPSRSATEGLVTCSE